MYDFVSRSKSEWMPSCGMDAVNSYPVSWQVEILRIQADDGRKKIEIENRRGETSYLL